MGVPSAHYSFGKSKGAPGAWLGLLALPPRPFPEQGGGQEESPGPGSRKGTEGQLGKKRGEGCAINILTDWGAECKFAYNIYKLLPQAAAVSTSSHFHIDPKRNHDLFFPFFLKCKKLSAALERIFGPAYSMHQIGRAHV